MDKKEYLCLNFNGEFLRLDASRIVYIKPTDHHNACIVLCDKTEETISMDIFQVRNAIVKNLKALASAFVYVEDFIVNLNYIQRIDVANQKLTISDGETFSYQLAVSKESLSKLKNKCVSFLTAQDPTQYPPEEEQVIGYPESDFSLINGHEYVDLGLSVKWATCNVGALNPANGGNFYAWGETMIKSEYTKANCITYNRYIRNIAANSIYDVVRIEWGGTWRLPTKAEMDELISKCKWIWITQDGQKGYKVTGPNGKSIFLPAAGWCEGSLVYSIDKHGSYWSATPSEDNTNSAYSLSFDFDGLFFIGDRGVYVDGYWGDRNNGFSVRPVSE